ncbi:MAG: penicillin-binding protein 1B, partial [Pseudomonadota bacterium]|nr:penicillin-binding protein 1B [Pseudomonadota bacterium]
MRNTGMGLIAVVLGIGGYVLYRLDANLRSSFEGRRWSVPAHVYSRSSALYPGLRVTVQDIESGLRHLGYRSVAVADRPGTWARSSDGLTVHVRGFYKASGYQSPERIRLIVVDDRIVSLNNQDGRSLPMAELEPQLIGSILPLRHEDRAPVRLHNVPEPLLKALLVMEDRRFLVHHGI